MLNIRIIKFFLIGAFITTFLGCSTQKNTPINRFYHSINTKYNGYFNARESFEEAVKNIEANWDESYDTLPPLFITGNPSDISANASHFDKAIEKAKKAIEKHSMFIQGVEYNTWIDDCYFLIGKCEFYKGNLDEALSYIEYSRKISKDEKLQSDGCAYKIILLIRKNEIDEAMSFFTSIAEKKLKTHPTSLLYTACAAIFLKIGDTIKADEFLKEAIKLEKSKKKRERLSLIRGILLYNIGDCKNTITSLNPVVRKTSDFKKEIYARIYTTRCKKITINEKIKEIITLKKQKRFTPYFDVIHLHSGEITLEKGDTNNALTIFEEGIKYPTSSKYVKAKMFYYLGQIYYALRNYELATASYDSAIKYLGESSLLARQIKDKQKILTELAQFLTKIYECDSLLYLASLPEDKRLSIVKQNLQKRKEKEEKKKKPLEVGYVPPSFSGDFYFYNQATVIEGYKQFITYWGRRPLSDYWQFSSLINEMPQESPQELSATENIEDEISKAMKNIPSSPSQIMSITHDLVYALYNAGIIYKENLQDYNKAIEMFSRIVYNYDTSAYAPPSAYHLYDIGLIIQEKSLSDTAKKILLTKYPSSPYTFLVAGKTKDTDQDTTNYQKIYESLFDLYKRKYYDIVIEKSTMLLEDNMPDEISAKVSILLGLALFKKGFFVEAKKKLLPITQNYSHLPEAGKAQELIAIVDSLSKHFIPEDFSQKIGLYEYNEKEPHLFAIIFKKIHIHPDTLTKWIKNYISSDPKKLNTFIYNLKKQNTLIAVGEFPNVSESFSFYKNFLINFPEMDKLPSPEIFIISQKNLQELISSEDISGYLTFFKKYYLQKKESN